MASLAVRFGFCRRSAPSAAPSRPFVPEIEELSDIERIKRRNELDRQMLEEKKKAAEENGDQ